MTDPSDPVSERPAAEQPAAPEQPHEPAERPDPLRSSRTSGTWVALVLSALVLVLLVIFIAQNTDDVEIAFLGWEGSAPLAVAILAAAVAGVRITALVGTLRIWQVRRRVRRERH